MKVLVLGAEGMLGHKILQTLASRFENVGGSIRGQRVAPPYKGIPLFFSEHIHIIQSVNAMNTPALERTISVLAPEVIVNCIGIIKQRDESSVALPSIAINSLLPHQLAHWAAKWGGRVIHFSTDCVFSGRHGGYTEDSLSDAEDLYGKSKYLGEVAAPNALTLRTSIIGRELSSFASLLEWFLAQEGKTIKGYKRVIYSGVTTNYMADLVCRIIAEQPKLSGLYQVTSPPISKFDLLCMLQKAYRLEVNIEPDEEVVSDRSMIGTRFVETTGYRQPAWDELVEQLASDPTPYQDWR